MIVDGPILSVVSGPGELSGLDTNDVGGAFQSFTIGEETTPMQEGVDYLVAYSAQAGINATDVETRLIVRANGFVGDLSYGRSPLASFGHQHNALRLQGYAIMPGGGGNFDVRVSTEDGDGVADRWYSGVCQVYAIPLKGFVEEEDYWKIGQHDTPTSTPTPQLSNAPTGSYSDVASADVMIPETGAYMVLMSVEAQVDEFDPANAALARFEVDGADFAGTDAGGGEGYQLEACPLPLGVSHGQSFACARVVELLAGTHQFRIRGRSRGSAVADFRRGRIIILKGSTMGPFHSSSVSSVTESPAGSGYARGNLPSVVAQPPGKAGQFLLVGSVTTMASDAASPGYRLRSPDDLSIAARDVGTMMVDAGYDSGSDLASHTLLHFRRADLEERWDMEARVLMGPGTIRSAVAGDGSSAGLAELIFWDLSPTVEELRRLERAALKETDVLARYLPTGRAWGAKLREGTVARSLLAGLGRELLRSTDLVQEFRDNVLPDQTVLLLSEWERAVGIPDDCFDGQGTASKRRRDVLVKLASLGVQTADDFKALAQLFGLGVIITGGSVHGTFPYAFPMIFFPSEKAARHTIVVNVTENPVGNVFPYTFPLTFGDELTTLVECLFRKLKPAHCDLLFLNL